MTRWKPNPILKRALSSGPEMLAIVALPILKRYGDEAKKIIINAMYQAGLKRGQNLATKAKNREDLLEFERLNVEDYNSKGFNTPGFNDSARKWIKKTSKHVIFNLSLCGGCESNIPEIWKDMGLDDDTIQTLGEIYCEPFDKGVRKGFNPKIELTFTKLAPRGDPYCEWDEKIID